MLEPSFLMMFLMVIKVLGASSRIIKESSEKDFTEAVSPRIFYFFSASLQDNVLLFKP